MDDENPCDNFNVIRSCSSSIVRAHSWSLGVGAQVDTTESNEPSLSNLDTQCNRSGSLNPFHNLTIDITTVYLIRGRNNSSSSAAPFSTNPTTTSYSGLLHSSSSSSSFHVYQLNLRTETGQEWSIYRRYSQFHSLHQKLKVKDPEIGKLRFPPKRRLNSKASTIVQDRRIKLEEYMRCLINYIGEKSSKDTDETTSQQLLDVLTDNSAMAHRIRDHSPSGRSSLTDSACSEPSNGSEASRQTDQQERLPGLVVDRAHGCVRTSSCNDEPTTGRLVGDFLGLREKQSESLDTGN